MIVTRTLNGEVIEEYEFNLFPSLPNDDDDYDLPQVKPANTMTTLETLEAKLNQYAEAMAPAPSAEPAETVNVIYSDENKLKKRRKKLVHSILNNADKLAEAEAAEAEDEDRPVPKTTLDTTYGMRFAPIITMFAESRDEFNDIIKDIRDDLNSPRCQTRTMYRSSQFGNLLTATKHKADVVKNIADIAKQISDLEYKKSKDDMSAGIDNSKAMAELATKYLRGDFDGSDDKETKGKDKKKTKKREHKRESPSIVQENIVNSFPGIPSGKSQPSIEELREAKKPSKKTISSDNDDLAKVLEQEVFNRQIGFTPHELHTDLEGTYEFMIKVDPDDTTDWDFVAVDPKSHKKIKGFKDSYAELLPDKRECRIKFDIDKGTCRDLNSGRTYKLIVR